MEVIKYRAWDESRKKMLPVDMLQWSSSGNFIENVQLLDGATIIRYRVDSLGETFKGILMQFTGLQDAKGRDIYEGDIVQDGIFRREVIFHRGVFCYQHGPKQFHIFADKDCEVIGNIYENPDLRK